MKIRTLALNNMNKEDIVNIRTISHDKIINNYNNYFHISLSNKHINKIRKKDENKKNKSSTMIKNNTLFKSLSINTNNDYKTLMKNRYNLTFIPKANTISSNYSSKNKLQKGFKFTNYISDEKFFCTSKNHKRFLFPKQNYIIKKSRINHDINFFNLRHVITDYTKLYEKNSYRIKHVINRDKFINKIKNDLLKLRFDNKIKLFDNI